MSEPILPRDMDLVRAVREIEEVLNSRKRTIIPLSVRIPGTSAYDAPTAAPTVLSRAAGDLNGPMRYVFNYYSSYSGRETPLSPVLSDTAVNESLTITGVRSLDPMMDKVRLWRRASTSGVDAYRLQSEFANPTSGDWTTVASTAYLGDAIQPLAFRYTLFTVCGVGWRLLKVKIAPDIALSPDSTNYWKLWLSRMPENGNSSEVISSQNDTKNVGFQTNRPYFLTPRVTPGGVPTDEYDFLLSENDRIDFNMRGVGAITFLPSLTVTLSLVHEEG